MNVKKVYYFQARRETHTEERHDSVPVEEVQVETEVAQDAVFVPQKEFEQSQEHFFLDESNDLDESLEHSFEQSHQYESTQQLVQPLEERIEPTHEEVHTESATQEEALPTEAYPDLLTHFERVLPVSSLASHVARCASRSKSHVSRDFFSTFWVAGNILSGRKRLLDILSGRKRLLKKLMWKKVM